MHLGGSLEIKGQHQLETLIENDEGPEFVFNMEKGNPKIKDFDISVGMDRDSDIKISAGDPDPDLSFIDVVFESDDKGKLEVTFSPKQAAVIKQILESYITAYYALESLQTVRKV